MPASLERGAGGERAFAARLLDPDCAAPRGLRVPAGGSADRRFSVYRNNVAVGLVATLAARFPVCRRLVGDAFFDAMASLFALQSPPRSAVMSAYGEGFPAFVAEFPPACGLPYLADVARLEVALGRAYHAADAEPLGPAAFGRFPQGAWGELVVGLHPSVNLVASPHAIVSLWETNTRDATVRPVAVAQAEDALVVRPHLAAAVSVLPPGGHAFLSALATGVPLARAAEEAAARVPAFDLAANLVILFRSGVAATARIGAAPL
ncbi:DNA-binding domain-containing protein [Methylobacterium soli]|uniref:DUF2063 domain-containing protein n=2 Tax=Methylobacterium soli TaxID=553447 RepID=A0A6L3T4P1_9HYPH|nr:DNA-binding domain-containing protein [Methylobacterium soli]KAB1081868.1 DUF2063 domain-containing protein [Methylobacterium soli]